MSFFDWLLARRESNPADDALEAAAHQVMAATDPRLMALHGAREKLLPAVAHALAYADRISGQLPPAIELAPGAWADQPTLRALFAQPGEIAQVLGASPDLQEFHRATAAEDLPQVFCILAASPAEQTTFSPPDNGQGDAERRSLSFSRFRLFAFSRTPSQLQARIRDALLEALVMAAMQRLASRREQALRLEADHLLLQNRIGLLAQSRAGLNGLDPAPGGNTDLADLRRQLGENEDRLARTRPGRGWLEATLETTAQVLAEAEQWLTIKPVTYWLDARNILTPPGTPGAASVTLMEITRPQTGEALRLTVPASIPSLDIAPRPLDIDQALRLL